MILALTAAIIFSVSTAFTYLVKNLALKNAILDVPNHRSLHYQPIPRGGGLSIVTLVFCCLIVLYMIDYISRSEAIILLASLLITAFIAFMDDLRPVSIKIRALLYCVSAACLVFFINPDINGFMKLLAVACIVWMINLYNFMDGIDGLASVEAITTSLFATFLFYQISAIELYWLSLTIACSCAGFLIWNWPPAKIFLGDVGSCSLGLLFSILALLAYHKYSVPVAIWLVLLSVFIADTSFTLLKRFLSGQVWYRAHKDHAYQQLIGHGYAHATVTSWVLMFNVLLLWPLAYVLYIYPQYSVVIVLFNYAILAIFWCYIQTRSIKITARKG